MQDMGEHVSLCWFGWVPTAFFSFSLSQLSTNSIRELRTIVIAAAVGGYAIEPHCFFLLFVVYRVRLVWDGMMDAHCFGFVVLSLPVISMISS